MLSQLPFNTALRLTSIALSMAKHAVLLARRAPKQVWLVRPARSQRSFMSKLIDE